jgi:stress response protein SCP2
VDLGSGDTLENVLFDISAERADVRILTSGTGWTIRNVGVRGKAQNETPLWLGGQGTVEHVYLGDGSIGGDHPNGSGMGPIGCWINKNPNSGPIVFDGVNISFFANNGIYGAPTADGKYGKVFHVRNSYFDSNNISAFKIGSQYGTCTVSNTTVRTDHEAPALESGAVNKRAIWALQGRTEITDSDLQGPIWTNSAEGAYAVLEDCAWSDGGRWMDDRGDVRGTWSGSPDLSPPAGVPMTPEAAASGTTDRDGTDGGSADDELARTLAVTTEEGGPLVEYELLVDGAVTAPDGVEANDEITANDDGTTTVTGVTGNGYADEFRFEGALEDVSASVADEHYSVVVDGEPIDLDQTRRTERPLTITTTEGGPLVEYELLVDGSVTAPDGVEANDEITANDDGTTTVTGVTGNGYADEYVLVGTLEDVSATVSPEHFDLSIDGKAVDLWTYVDAERSLTVSTNQGGPLVEYELLVDGVVTAPDGVEANDEITANDDGTTTVTGVTGNGYADEYVLVGTLEDVSANVTADHYSVTIDGERQSR